MPRLKKGILKKKKPKERPPNTATYSCCKILKIFTIQVHIIFLILKYIQPEYAQSHYLGMNDSTCSDCCRYCWLLLVMESGKFFMLSVTVNDLIKVRVLSLRCLEQYQTYYD